MRNKLLFASMIFLFSICIYLVYSYSFIVISTPDNVSSSIKRSVSNANEANLSPGNHRKLVKRGLYEVEAVSDVKSSFSLVEAKGFFGTVKVNLSAPPEQAQRTFKGNNPGECVYTIRELLASSSCNSLIDEVSLHIPATQQSPTFKQSLVGPAAVVEDALRINNQDHILVQAESDNDSEGTFHELYTFAQPGLVDNSSVKRLADLNGSYLYKVLSYKEGYLVYSLDPLELMYFKDFNSKPEKIPVQNNSEDLAAVDVKVQGRRIVLLLTNYLYRNKVGLYSGTGSAHSHTVEHEETEQAISTKSEIIVVEDSVEVTRKILNYRLAGLAICENELICTISATNSHLQVFKLSNALNLQYELGDVYGVSSNSSRTVVIRKKGLYLLNVTERSGSLLYSPHDFEFCGLHDVSSGLYVCTADSKGNTRLLEISSSQQTNYLIDRIIQKLIEVNAVSNVSVYGKYVTISPFTGKPVLNSQTGGFEYDPEAVSSSKSQINKELEGTGLNENGYMVNFTIN